MELISRQASHVIYLKYVRLKKDMEIVISKHDLPSEYKRDCKLLLSEHGSHIDKFSEMFDRNIREKPVVPENPPEDIMLGDEGYGNADEVPTPPKKVYNYLHLAIPGGNIHCPVCGDIQPGLRHGISRQCGKCDRIFVRTGHDTMEEVTE